jgi:toluene monooxygenase system protein B
MIWRFFRPKRPSPEPTRKEMPMSELFPLVINFQGDYGMKVLMVDPQATVGDVAQLAKDGLVGVVVKPLPEGTVLVVKRHGEGAVLDNSLKVADAGFIKMEALDIVHAA